MTLRAVASLAAAAALLAAAAAPAHASVRRFWVAAEPVTWNAVPNGRDAIMGTRYGPAQTVFPTVVYRRYTRNWRHTLPNTLAGSSNQDLIPGPLLRARVGDRVVVHFKNLDATFRRPPSRHFHGVHSKPSSDEESSRPVDGAGA